MNKQSMNNQSAGLQSKEYVSPDTELKFLEELVKEETVTSKDFKITRGAFNKAMTYAKAIGQIAGTGIECYGYLLKPSDSMDNMITDIFFAPNQTNQSAYVRVSAEGVYQSSQEIEPKDLMIVGWWHSHGSFNTFHSGTDVRNFEVVLHSIAPRTMYKNEKGQYIYDADKKQLLVNGTKIKGIDIPENAQLDVLHKVEQDPYAYSMVVNMRREYYLEKITKTLLSNGQDFRLNPPVRPDLELMTVENDVKYTISEIEDDITGKIDITGGFHGGYNGDSYFGSQKNFRGKSGAVKASSKNQSKTLSDKLVDFEIFMNKNKHKTEVISKFLETIKDGVPEYLDSFIEGVKGNERLILSRLRVPDATASTQGANLKTINAAESAELSDILGVRFADVPENYASDKAYDIQRLRDELTWHFVNDYSNNPSTDIANKYSRIDNTLSGNFNTAVNAGKALAKYSMERFTDYAGESGFKYKNFIGHLLENMNTKDRVSIDSSLKRSKDSRYDPATDRLFLYEDRLNIINNMLTTLTFKSKEPDFKDFLTEFATEYQTDPRSKTLDSIIEKKLLSPMGVSDFNSYIDRASYERKGVLGKIFTGVRSYFGGSRNV